MASNGTDLGHIAAMLQQVIATLGEVINTQGDHTRLMNDHSRILNEHSRILGEHTRVLNGHTTQIYSLEQRFGNLSADLAGLRNAVNDYHGSVLGHGIMLTELDARLHRVERQLDLPDPSPHA